MIYLDKNHCFVSGDGFQDLDLFFPALPGQAQRIFMSSSRDVDLNLRNLLRSPSGAVAPSSRRAAWKKGGQEASRNIWNMELKDDMVWYDLIWYYDIYIYMLLSDIANLESREHISVSKIWNPKIAWNKTSFTIIFPVENAPQVGLSIHLFHKDWRKIHHPSFDLHLSSQNLHHPSQSKLFETSEIKVKKILQNSKTT